MSASAYRVVGALIVMLASFAFCAVSARADGDPASDWLVDSNVFWPYTAAPHADTTALFQQVKAVYAAGYRIKVAVVASRSDLGSIPSLFDKPREYARFLGEELAQIYVGPLLIVMPAGYGIYDGGRSTGAESRVLANSPQPRTMRPDELIRLATEVVQRLTRAGALRSRDILPPYVSALAATAAGGTLTLLYYLADDSGRAALTIDIMQGGQLALAVREPMAEVNPQRNSRRTIRLPAGLALSGARVCISAADPAANKSPSSCTTIKSSP